MGADTDAGVKKTGGRRHRRKGKKICGRKHRRKVKKSGGRRHRRRTKENWWTQTQTQD